MTNTATAAVAARSARAPDPAHHFSQDKLKGGATSKIERYGWTIKDEPGVQLEIPKHDLVVDESYQRPETQEKILALARAWSWMACGVISVADRDGVFYVFDGNNRACAARLRSDITNLPCIVFSTVSAVTEAEGFLRANTFRKPITGIDKFRALVVTEDPAAMAVRALCEEAGRTIQYHDSATSVRCVSTLLRLATNNKDALERLWPLINALMLGRTLLDRVVQALVYIEENMPEGESLTDRHWRERVLNAGADNLLNAANRAAALYCRGGAKVWATGMVEAINFKARNRLVLRSSDYEAIASTTTSN
jgi:hypothetical protein